MAGAALMVCLAIYLPGLSGPLLFDDRPALTVNQLVQVSGAEFDRWRVAAFSSYSGPLRRPLAMLSFAANHAVAGTFSPVGLKAVNLGIHLAIATLLFSLFRRVLGALEIGRDSQVRCLIAFVAASVWLLHPLHVSTVLYAVQRMAQLATLFAVAGLWVFVRYRQQWVERGASAGELVAAALWLLLLTVLAALSKESGALLPWLLMVMEVCVFRGRWAGRPNAPLRVAGWGILLLPVVAVVLLYLTNPQVLERAYAGREFTLVERLLTQARVLWRYLGWLCLPNINDMGFQHDDIPLSTSLLRPFSTLVAVCAWLVVVPVAFLSRRRYPLLLLAVLFFLVGQSMESSVIPLEMVYEHRNYLPGIFVCLALAWAVVTAASRSARVNTWYPVFGVLAVLCLSLFIRVQTWSDELTLSRVNLAQHPQSSRSNYFYANALLRHFRQAEQLGLGQREQDESLILSRHYFERMYQTNDRDVASLVMLYYLDSVYFTQLQQQVDWLEKLDELLNTRTLQASDWNALTTLFEILADRADETNADRVAGLLDKLSGRYPASPAVLRYRYDYLSARNEEAPQLIPLLQRAQALTPAAFWPYYFLLYEYSREGDSASMYEEARRWLAHDRNRERIGDLKELFGPADE